MINLVLKEIESAQGAINLNDLSRSLGVDRTALEGMIQLLIRKGRLVDEDVPPTGSDGSCSMDNCGTSCYGPGECTFIAKMPKSYSMPPKKRSPEFEPDGT